MSTTEYRDEPLLPNYDDAVKCNTGPPSSEAAKSNAVYAQVDNYAGSESDYSDFDPNKDPEAAVLVKPEGFGFDEASIRRGFIRKVFGILAVQLTVVTALIALFVFHHPSKLFVQRHYGLYFVSYGVFMVSYLVLVCVRSARRTFPANVICLVVLTASIGYMAAMISSYHDTKIVLGALGTCSVCCVAIILFSLQTKIDFTKWVGVLFVAGFVTIIFGFLAITIYMTTGSNIMYLLYSGAMALIFMVWLAIDIQMVMGGRELEISPEDYVMAATELFLDIIYIFLMILQVFGGSGNN